ncbi:hypothetical protein B0H17DRAFT_1129141 [Mycena rosella]|uniref:Uncharacterized protein n=1 Tax=Mycena rosella TaxID=1033263 RepID=A0AAD7DU88_MYCRO|nr:hypothetical protein B0H17DRAFT_1129141 [Mycena rosella]
MAVLYSVFALGALVNLPLPPYNAESNESYINLCCMVQAMVLIIPTETQVLDALPDIYGVEHVSTRMGLCVASDPTYSPFHHITASVTSRVHITPWRARWQPSLAYSQVVVVRILTLYSVLMCSVLRDIFDRDVGLFERGAVAPKCLDRVNIDFKWNDIDTTGFFFRERALKKIEEKVENLTSGKTSRINFR